MQSISMKSIIIILKVFLSWISCIATYLYTVFEIFTDWVIYNLISIGGLFRQQCTKCTPRDIKSMRAPIRMKIILINKKYILLTHAHTHTHIIKLHTYTVHTHSFELFLTHLFLVIFHVSSLHFDRHTKDYYSYPVSLHLLIFSFLLPAPAS